MSAVLDNNAVISAFELPDNSGLFPPQFQKYFRAISDDKPMLLLAFAPKAAGTFFRQAAIDALGGYLFRGVQAQGGRDGVPYLPNFIASYLDEDCLRPVAHLHMQALPANRHFMEMFDLRPVIMIRNIPDMLASYWEMLEADPTARNDGLNCLIPPDFIDMRPESKADFMINIIAPWYVSYFATWQTYCEESSSVCCLRYENFCANPALAIHVALTHAGFVVPLSTCEASVGKIERQKELYRFNKGVAGRGRRYFGTEHINRISQMIRCYGHLEVWREELLGSSAQPEVGVLQHHAIPHLRCPGS